MWLGLEYAATLSFVGPLLYPHAHALSSTRLTQFTLFSLFNLPFPTHPISPTLHTLHTLPTHPRGERQAALASQEPSTVPTQEQATHLKVRIRFGVGVGVGVREKRG